MLCTSYHHLYGPSCNKVITSNNLRFMYFFYTFSPFNNRMRKGMAEYPYLSVFQLGSLKHLLLLVLFCGSLGKRFMNFSFTDILMVVLFDKIAQPQPLPLPITPPQLVVSLIIAWISTLDDGTGVSSLFWGHVTSHCWRHNRFASITVNLFISRVQVYF